jgi:hypothetical protein
MKVVTSLTTELAGTDDIYVLSRSSPAVQSIQSGSGSNRWGPIIRLPPGTRVRVCGAGFNSMTVNVEAEGCSYFIFREDLVGREITVSSFRENLKKLRSKLSRKEGRA